MVSTIYQIGPSETPFGLKWLIFLTIIISIFTAVFDPIFTYFSGTVGLAYLLSLSKIGMAQFFIWQPITHLFLLSSSYGIHLFFLISLIFTMYFLWVIGASVCERIGSMQFIYFYLIAGAISGLAALTAASPFTFIAGPWASLMSLFTLWTMMGPEYEMLLFFILPLKRKILFGIVVGFLLLNSLSQLDLSTFLLYLSAIIAGYLYGLLKWEFRSPYEFLLPLDNFLFRRKKQFFKKKKAVQPTKIYDLRTGEPLMDDDQFVDAMLSKIAKLGEESLTRNELKRLKEISEKKRKDF